MRQPVPCMRDCSRYDRLSRTGSQTSWIVMLWAVAQTGFWRSWVGDAAGLIAPRWSIICCAQEGVGGKAAARVSADGGPC